MFKCSQVLDSDQLLMIYCSFILLYLNYCFPIWVNNNYSRLKVLNILQKKCIRCIAKVDFKEHASKLFIIYNKQYNILKLNDIVQLNTLLLMYKINYNNVLPNLKMFMYMKEVHTRRVNNVFMTSCRTSYRIFGQKHMGAKLWNQLPESLKCSSSKSLFKRKVKSLLTQDY